MQKKSLLLAVASILVGLGIILSFTYFVNQPNLESEQNIPVRFLTEEQYVDEIIRKVETPNSKANQVLFNCGIDVYCIIENLQEITRKESETDIIPIVRAIMMTFENQGFWCHQQGHHIGKFMLGYSNGDVHKALKMVDRSCNGAMYHGIFENYLEKSVLLDKVEPDDINVSNACDAFQSKKEGSLECAHGMGHGLTKIYDYNLHDAVKRCDEFSIHSQNQVCYRGVFMENLVAYLDQRGGQFKESDKFFPCNEFVGESAKSCYTYQVSYLRTLDSMIPMEKQCREIEDAELVKYCYFGIIELNFYLLNDVQEIVERCKKKDVDFRPYCFANTVVLLTDWKGSAVGLEFCKKTPSQFKQECYDYLGKIIVDLNQQEECAKAESKEYEGICRNADLNDLHLMIT